MQANKIQEAAKSLQVVMGAAASAGFSSKIRGFFSSTTPNPLDIILIKMIKEMLSDKPIRDVHGFINGLDKNYTNWLKQHSEVAQKLHHSQLDKYKNLHDHAKRLEQLLLEMKAEHPAIVKKSKSSEEVNLTAWLTDLAHKLPVDSDLTPLTVDAQKPQPLVDEGVQTALFELGEEVNFYTTDASWREIDDISYDPQSSTSMPSAHIHLRNTLKTLMIDESDDEDETIEETQTSPLMNHWLSGWLASTVVASAPTEATEKNGMQYIVKKMHEKDRETSNSNACILHPSNSNTPKL